MAVAHAAAPRHDPLPRAELLAGAVTRDAWLPDDKNYVGTPKSARTAL